jgi:hypothetical protein
MWRLQNIQADHGAYGDKVKTIIISEIHWVHFISQGQIIQLSNVSCQGVNGTSVHVLFIGKQDKDHYDDLLPDEEYEKLKISEKVCFYRNNRWILTLFSEQLYSIKFSISTLIGLIFQEHSK